jgi:hypothetical protein
MAVAASEIEGTPYLVVDDLAMIKNLLTNFDNKHVFDKIVSQSIEASRLIFNNHFDKEYGDWSTFAQQRSTVIIGDTAIKHAGRMKRNFTDSSQRAGHIAVGEMYLTKFLFPKHKIVYLWPRMSNSDVLELDKTKQDDKEWKLLRNEPNVRIATRDDLIGLEASVIDKLYALRNDPLKGTSLTQYKQLAKKIQYGLETDKYRIEV